MKLHCHLGQGEMVSVAWRVLQAKENHAQAQWSCTPVMPPLPAAVVRQKIKKVEQSVPGGDQTAGAQLVSHAIQFCNSRTSGGYDRWDIFWNSGIMYTNTTTILAWPSIVCPRLYHLDLEVLDLHLPILWGKQPYLKPVVKRLQSWDLERGKGY